MESLIIIASFQCVVLKLVSNLKELSVAVFKLARKLR